MPDAPTSSSDSPDLLDRQPFAQKLESFLLTEHTFVEGSLVVSLDAPFGAGKTKFLELWTADLAARRQTQNELPRPVTINAWESDYCGDPLVAIIAALIKALEDSAGPEKAKGRALRDAAKDVGWFTVGILNGIVSNATGIDVLAAAELPEKKKAQREEAAQPPRFNALEVYEQKRTALGALHEKLKDIFGGDSPKAIVCIDELDRCRPDYAISYLEAIKHVFNIHGIVFVLAVDEQQLESATTVLFGPKLVFREYYRKFAHRTVRLPEPAEQHLARLTEDYVTRYLQKEGTRWSKLRLEEEKITQLIRCYHLKPRQAQEVFRTLGHLCSRNVADETGLQDGYALSALFMAVLRVANKDDYQRIGQNQLPIQELESVLTPLKETEDGLQRWFYVLAFRFKRVAGWESAMSNELKRLKFADESFQVSSLNQGPLGHERQTWAHGSDGNDLAQIYRRIEGLQTFGR